MAVAIWWIRRDLRLHDNEALAAALAHAEQVIPLFVLDPALHRSPYVGEKRLAFLYGGLRALDRALRERGGRLIVREGRPDEVLPRLAMESSAAAIYAEADHSPYAVRRDSTLLAAVPLHLVDGVTVFPPGAVLKADGTPYTIFTPFSRKWRALPLPGRDDVLPSPDRLSVPGAIAGVPLPELPRDDDSALFPPGEHEARRRLAAFTGRSDAPVYAYRDDRDRMALTGTSGLSPYLRFGMLSARKVVVAAGEAVAAAPSSTAGQNAEIWLNELIWREFYIHILAHFPHVRRTAFRENLRSIRWMNNDADFAAWCAGQTGYPVVDAAMRQLAATGWMHNRARMIAASFLTKDLLIDWKWGERWFMQNLLDGDPAANNGGWQWAAGTGTDAAPYFRIFNPTAQGQKFDPEGVYVRRWVPELVRVPLRYIHEPWRMSLVEQRGAHCLIRRNYPSPIVDHTLARGRALAAYRAAKDGG